MRAAEMREMRGKVEKFNAILTQNAIDNSAKNMILTLQWSAAALLPSFSKTSRSLLT